MLESDMSRLEGPAAVVAMVESGGQQALIRQGCAHVQSAPIVTVDGDRAVAIAYSQVFLHAEEGHEVWRVSANRWECQRTPSGWRLTRRVNRVIDGEPAARSVLRAGFRRTSLSAPPEACVWSQNEASRRGPCYIGMDQRCDGSLLGRRNVLGLNGEDVAGRSLDI